MIIHVLFVVFENWHLTFKNLDRFLEERFKLCENRILFVIHGPKPYGVKGPLLICIADRIISSKLRYGMKNSFVFNLLLWEINSLFQYFGQRWWLVLIFLHLSHISGHYLAINWEHLNLAWRTYLNYKSSTSKTFSNSPFRELLSNALIFLWKSGSLLNCCLIFGILILSGFSNVSEPILTLSRIFGSRNYYMSKIKYSEDCFLC